MMRYVLAVLAALVCVSAHADVVTQSPNLLGTFAYPSQDTTSHGTMVVGVGAVGAGPTALSYESVFIGDNAGGSVTTGTNMVGIGHRAINADTAGGNNTCVGWNCLTTVQTGNWNVAMGHDAGAQLNGSSSNNTCIGEGTCFLNGVAGPLNQTTAIGAGALLTATNDFNVAVGYNALNLLGNSQGNTAIGTDAGAVMTTGAFNIIIGLNAVRNTILTGNSNFVLGVNVEPPAAASANSMNVWNVIAGDTGGATNPSVCIVGVPCVLGVIRSANFNSTADQTIPIRALTTGNGVLSSVTKYWITEIDVTNCSASLTTAKGGVYTAASKGGTIIGATTTPFTACTSTTTRQRLTALTNEDTTTLTAASLFLSLTTTQGGAATADVYVIGMPVN